MSPYDVSSHLVPACQSSIATATVTDLSRLSSAAHYQMYSSHKGHISYPKIAAFSSDPVSELRDHVPIPHATMQTIQLRNFLERPLSSPPPGPSLYQEPYIENYGPTIYDYSPESRIAELCPPESRPSKPQSQIRAEPVSCVNSTSPDDGMDEDDEKENDGYHGTSDSEYQDKAHVSARPLARRRKGPQNRDNRRKAVSPYPSSSPSKADEKSQSLPRPNTSPSMLERPTYSTSPRRSRVRAAPTENPTGGNAPILGVDYDEFYDSSGLKMYQCKKCPNVRTRAFGDLTRHLEALAHGPPKYKCDVCGNPYTRLDALKRHQLATHKGGRTR